MKFKEQIGQVKIYQCENAEDEFWAEQNHLVPGENGEIWISEGTEGAKLLEEKVILDKGTYTIASVTEDTLTLKADKLEEKVNETETK